MAVASWEGWKKVAGETHSGPGVSAGPNGQDAYVRGTDNQVYTGRFAGGGFHGWTPMPGLATTTAPATAVNDGSVYVFARAEDGRIFYARSNGGTGDGWHEVPGGERTDSAVGAADGILVARRGDGGIRYITYDGSGPVLGFSGWADVPDGGRTPSAPAIAKLGHGWCLFVRGTDDGIHYKDLNSNMTKWGSWHKVPGGGLTHSTPAVAEGTLIVRGTDNGIHMNEFGGVGSSWDGWKRIGGATPDAPALAFAGGFTVLVVRGTDNGVHYNILS